MCGACLCIIASNLCNILRSKRELHEHVQHAEKQAWITLILGKASSLNICLQCIFALPHWPSPLSPAWDFCLLQSNHDVLDASQHFALGSKPHTGNARVLADSEFPLRSRSLISQTTTWYLQQLPRCTCLTPSETPLPARLALRATILCRATLPSAALRPRLLRNPPVHTVPA
jgi:hypothetical protein